MPLIFDGVTIEKINFDGVAIDNLFFDGVEVFTSVSADLSGISNIYSTDNGAGYIFNLNGTHSKTTNDGTTAFTPDWLTSGNVVDLQVKMTEVSGSFYNPSAPVNEWAPIDDYQWINVIPAPSGDSTISVKLEIGTKDDVVIASKSFTIRTNF